MVHAQPCPKPNPPVCRCNASEGSIVGLVVRKVVDRNNQVRGRVHLLPVHERWLIEDALYLAVVDDGFVQELNVLREFLILR
jgi:hypothetical protein